MYTYITHVYTHIYTHVMKNSTTLDIYDIYFLLLKSHSELKILRANKMLRRHLSSERFLTRFSPNCFRIIPMLMSS